MVKLIDELRSRFTNAYNRPFSLAINQTLLDSFSASLSFLLSELALIMSPTEGEGDILFLVRILLASALALALASASASASASA